MGHVGEKELGGPTKRKSSWCEWEWLSFAMVIVAVATLFAEEEGMGELVSLWNCDLGVVVVVGVCKGREVLGAFYTMLWRGVFVGKKGGCGGWVGVDEEEGR